MFTHALEARAIQVSDELYREYQTPYWQAVRAHLDRLTLESLAIPTPPL